MTLSRSPQDPLSALRFAVSAMGETLAGGGLLAKWIASELDDSGTPLRMPLDSWATALALLAEAHVHDSAPLRIHGERVTTFVKACLRFARPDGSMCFGDVPVKSDTLGRFALALSDDPGVARVVAWWFPRLIDDDFELGAPFLPAEGAADRPLACLRSDWTKRGEWITVDARSKGSDALVELGIGGQPWLGPLWQTGLAASSAAKSKPIHWTSRSMADLFEWSVKAGTTKVTRTVVLLRGQKLALLAEEHEGPPTGADPSWSIGLASGIEARTSVEHAALRLDATGPRGSALAIPLGLPTQPGKMLSAAEGRLVLAQPGGARRCWLPLLLSWDGLRNKRNLTWRRLTVAEKSKTVPSDVAVAARVSFGREETLVVYRSLGKPALRSFLGHQTTARFLIGSFNAQGNIEPIVTIKD